MYRLTLKFLTVHFMNQNSNFDIHINDRSSGCITMRAIQNERSDNNNTRRWGPQGRVVER